MEGVIFWMGGEEREGTRAFVFIRTIHFVGVTLDLSQASLLPGRKDGLSSVVLEDGGSAIGDRGRPHGASRLDAGVQFAVAKRNLCRSGVCCVFSRGNFWCAAVQGAGTARGGV